MLSAVDGRNPGKILAGSADVGTRLQIDTLASLSEACGAGMAALDTRARIVWASTGFARWLGETPATLTGTALISRLRLMPGDRLRTDLLDLVTGARGDFATRWVSIRCPGRPGSAGIAGVTVHRPGGGRQPVVVVRTAEDEPGAGPRGLTRTEVRILTGLAAGRSTDSLSQELRLGRKDVEYHIGVMLRRLAVPNRTALVAKAYSLRILRPGEWPPRDPGS
ncbi:LuxR C-terminal-related transcriptional regulator [Streptomyces sp. NPDC091279]|uniref:LuxR C-terminal-related transcriptional regulator n=1 Tax=unclassified Streptomyces TaxID=2593676 RepID=UPI0038070DAD